MNYAIKKSASDFAFLQKLNSFINLSNFIHFCWISNAALLTRFFGSFYLCKRKLIRYKL